MKQKALFAATLLCFAGSLAWAQAGDPVDIRRILMDADYWQNREVRVEGFVRDIQVVEVNFVHYRIENLTGDEVWVKKETRSNADHPILHQKVLITATVHRSSEFRAADSEIILVEELPPPLPWWLENLLLVVLLVVFFLLFMALVLVLLWPTVFRRKNHMDSAEHSRLPLQVGLPDSQVEGGAASEVIGGGISDEARLVSERQPEEAPLRVFLCYASGDKVPVRRLYSELLATGFDPWLDEEKLLPGQNWEGEIRRAVRRSDVVLICLSSRSTSKKGFIQKEIRLALDAAELEPEGEIFLVPVRLEECDVPPRLEHVHYVDIFAWRGYERLVASLAARANSLGK